MEFLDKFCRNLRGKKANLISSQRYEEVQSQDYINKIKKYNKKLDTFCEKTKLDSFTFPSSTINFSDFTSKISTSLEKLEKKNQRNTVDGLRKQCNQLLVTRNDVLGHGLDPLFDKMELRHLIDDKLAHGKKKYDKYGCRNVPNMVYTGKEYMEDATPTLKFKGISDVPRIVATREYSGGRRKKSKKIPRKSRKRSRK